MRYSVSDTAEFGDYTRGPRIITEETRDEMRQILYEVQTGEFAKEWILENQARRPVFNALRRQEAEHPIEEVGRSSGHDGVVEKIGQREKREMAIYCQLFGLICFFSRVFRAKGNEEKEIQRIRFL